MFNGQQEEMIKSDFEKFLNHLKLNTIPFTFELFVDFSSSLLNFYIGSASISLNEKEDASQFLIELYNRGLPKVISTEDRLLLSDLIVNSAALNYSLIDPIFNQPS